MTWIEREMRHASHLQLLSGNIFHVNLFNTTKKISFGKNYLWLLLLFTNIRRKCSFIRKHWKWKHVVWCSEMMGVPYKQWRIYVRVSFFRTFFTTNAISVKLFRVKLSSFNYRLDLFFHFEVTSILRWPEISAFHMFQKLIHTIYWM